MQKRNKADRVQEPRRASGGQPLRARADLLPPVVEVRRKQKATRRMLVLGLVGLAVVVAVGAGAAALIAQGKDAGLAAEKARNARLVQEQAQYVEVSTVRAQLVDWDTAQLAALYAEADWARMMRELDAALPGGSSITSEAITVKGQNGGVEPVAALPPLDAPGLIEVSFTANAESFVATTPLLDRLADMTGYASADVSAVASAEEGYVITGVVRLSSAALGGTARVANLDPATADPLRAALETAVTQPPPAPATDDTTGAADELAAGGQ